jgi:hypothetical protein
LIKAVADKSLPFDHPVVQHVGLCDFCLEDINRLRARQRHLRVASATGIALLLAIFAGGFFLSRRGLLNNPRQTTEMAVDLRPVASERGDSMKARDTIPNVPPQSLKLSFVLPLGLDLGDYEIRLMDNQLRVVRQTVGKAVLQNFEVHLTAQLDLTNLAPGAYRLWIRQHNRSWRDYPLQVR